MSCQVRRQAAALTKMGQSLLSIWRPPDDSPGHVGKSDQPRHAAASTSPTSARQRTCSTEEHIAVNCLEVAASELGRQAVSSLQKG